MGSALEQDVRRYVRMMDEIESAKEEAGQLKQSIEERMLESGIAHVDAMVGLVPSGVPKDRYPAERLFAARDRIIQEQEDAQAAHFARQVLESLFTLARVPPRENRPRATLRRLPTLYHPGD